MGLVVGVAEASAPVGEVGGDDEDGGGVREVGREEVAVGAFGRGGGGTDEDGDYWRMVCWIWYSAGSCIRSLEFSDHQDYRGFCGLFRGVVRKKGGWLGHTVIGSCKHKVIASRCCVLLRLHQWTCVRIDLFCAIRRSWRGRVGGCRVVFRRTCIVRVRSERDSGGVMARG